MQSRKSTNPEESADRFCGWRAQLRRRMHRRLRSLGYVRISTKLTCLYAVMLLLVLLVVSICTSIGVYSSFSHQAEVGLEMSIQHMTEAMKTGRPVAEILWSDDPVMPGVVLRITDMAGGIVYENDAHFPSIQEIEDHTLREQPFWAKKGLLVSELGNSTIYHATVSMEYHGDIYQLHFFKTITAERNFLTTLQRILLIMTISGFLLALFAGYLVSDRILKPIRDLTATARRIEVERMDRRIDVLPVHDELSELADTFNHMLDRLQAGLQQQQRFVSDASHELRTPITVILGYSDLLSRWGRSDQAILDEGISSIRSEAEDMQQLVERLLFLARADQQRQVLHKENVELSELLDDVVRKMQVATKTHTVELRHNDDGMIYADQSAMRQMLRVFLDNSRKYTPEGGHIWVDSRLNPDGKTMRLELGDDGIGIAKKDHEKIFERFYRVDTSRTKGKSISGTGLGLSIAQWIAEQHQIKIDIDSDLGKGTKFILTVPLVDV